MGRAREDVEMNNAFESFVSSLESRVTGAQAMFRMAAPQ
jgi:hypothetical protein